ncbi:MAG: hypothetical protein WCD48_19425 [Candidatus Sulfotelmatobacter sp.]
MNQENGKEVNVIARIWHGSTKPEHADAYEAMLKPERLPGVAEVKGYKGSFLLRKNHRDEIDFITIMLWDSTDAIRDFVGPDYETSVIPKSAASTCAATMPRQRITKLLRFTGWHKLLSKPLPVCPELTQSNLRP